MWQSDRPSTAELPPDRRFQRLKAEIHRVMVEALDISQISQWPPQRLRREVGALANQMSVQLAEPLSDAERERLTQELLDETFGLGPLEGLMNDPTVDDILVNGPGTVYVERHGRL